MRPTALFLTLLTVGCLRTDDVGPGTSEPTQPPVSTATLATSEPTLPTDWQGSGVLARATYDVPPGAPAWTAVTAEVMEQGEARRLIAVGRVASIKNDHLARTTATARAHAELSRWVKSASLVGAEVVETYRDPASGVTFARVALTVPSAWTPGQPLNFDREQETP